MTTNGNKPDLDDLKARLGLKPTAAKPGGPTAGPPRGAQGPPGSRGPQAAQPAAQPQAAQPQAAQPQPQAAPQPSLGNLPGMSLGAAPNVGPNAKPKQEPAPEPVMQQPVAQQPVAQQASQQQPAAPRGPSKPPAQVGPPAGSRPKRARQEPAFNPAELPVGDVDVDESAGQRGAFSPAVIGVGAGVLVVGLILGYFAASSTQARKMYTAQTNAAKQVKTRLDPAVTNAKKAIALVGQITKDPTVVKYDVPKQILDLKFVPDSGAVNGLIGGQNVFSVNQFMAKASVLKQMVKQHNYLTNTVDKKELEELVKNNKIIQGDKKFAVIYNYKTLLNHLKAKKEDNVFKPSPGRLVLLESWKVDEKGMVQFTNLSNNQKDSFSVKGVVPLDAGEILKSGGQNALQRYTKRVAVMSFYAKDLEKSLGGLMGPIDKLANRGDAPLIQFGSSESSAPAEPTPAPEAAPAAK